MKLLLLALPYALASLSATYAAYLSVHDHSKSWTGFQEDLWLAPPLGDLDSHYICDVAIGEDAFQISVHSASPDDWSTADIDEKHLSEEHVTYINQHLRTNLGRSTSKREYHSPSLLKLSTTISCRHPTQPKSVLQQRIGFMHVVDFLSILGVGFVAATASGVAAWLRRHEHSKRSDVMTALSRQPRLDHFHEHPSTDNLHETEFALNYIKSKLG
jgi:hypothetical protein